MTMHVHKQVLCEERTRCVPRQFSWIDQRLIRDGFCRRCNAEALALYLVLLAAGDANGLSYYSDSSLARLLSVSVERLPVLRDGLIDADLIAYRTPLYQVLSLPAVHS